MTTDLVTVTAGADDDYRDMAAALVKAAGEDRQHQVRMTTDGIRKGFRAPADLVSAAGLTPDPEPDADAETINGTRQAREIEAGGTVPRAATGPTTTTVDPSTTGEQATITPGPGADADGGEQRREQPEQRERGEGKTTTSGGRKRRNAKREE